jgi:glycosyltransferase involved in cell wall biosynthesis
MSPPDAPAGPVSGNEAKVQDGSRSIEPAPPRLESLSVFLPAHNEAGNIERVVNEWCAELPRVTDDWEVIIVDDGSRDGTGAIADRLSAADPRVRVVHHEVNRGYGGAVISGITACSKSWILLCDGDGQFEPADIEILARAAGERDVVVGRRGRRADPFMRRLNGRAWTILMRILFGIAISDIDCGFKLFRRELVVPAELKARGAMISTELMARMAGRGARLAEVDVRHLPRQSGQQSGASLRVIMRAFRELMVLYRDLKSEGSAPRGQDGTGAS